MRQPCGILYHIINNFLGCALGELGTLHLRYRLREVLKEGLCVLNSRDSLQMACHDRAGAESIDHSGNQERHLAGLLQKRRQQPFPLLLFPSLFLAQRRPARPLQCAGTFFRADF